MNSRLPSNTGVGAASILMIVVMLCMTLFSALSLLTAKNDAKLSDKTIEYSQDYYAADAKAQLMLADISDALLNDAPLPGGVEREGDSLSFSVNVNDSSAIFVRLKTTGEKGLIIESYGTASRLKQYVQQDTIELWQ